MRNLSNLHKAIFGICTEEFGSASDAGDLCLQKRPVAAARNAADVRVAISQTHDEPSLRVSSSNAFGGRLLEVVADV
jgi:hypothetical protein